MPGQASICQEDVYWEEPEWTYGGRRWPPTLFFHAKIFNRVYRINEEKKIANLDPREEVKNQTGERISNLT